MIFNLILICLIWTTIPSWQKNVSTILVSFLFRLYQIHYQPFYATCWQIWSNLIHGFFWHLFVLFCWRRKVNPIVPDKHTIYESTNLVIASSDWFSMYGVIFSVPVDINSRYTNRWSLQNTWACFLPVLTGLLTPSPFTSRTSPDLTTNFQPGPQPTQPQPQPEPEPLAVNLSAK